MKLEPFSGVLLYNRFFYIYPLQLFDSILQFCFSVKLQGCFEDIETAAGVPSSQVKYLMTLALIFWSGTAALNV